MLADFRKIGKRLQRHANNELLRSSGYMKEVFSV